LETPLFVYCGQDQSNTNYKEETMLSWKDYYVQEQVRNDRLEEAKQARLVKSVSRQKGSAFKKVSVQLQEKVGSQLVQWGESLRGRSPERPLVSES
jgi:hypothetical protein